MIRQDYSYSLDCDNNLINIKDAIKGNNYYCPCCGAPMITKQGTKNRWHFAHSINASNCSYESYLHKIAKHKIRECFEHSPIFYITINSKATCRVIECPMGKSTPCLWLKPYTFDLKKYYNICEEEAHIGNFRADLLISSLKHKTDPILIEIYVSHKSTTNKINSNYRIIEIQINSEEDIKNVISYFTIGNNPELNQKVKYYNFRPSLKSEFPHPKYQKPIYRFWIDNKKNFHFNTPYDYRRPYKCLSRINQQISNSIFKIESLCEFSLDFAFYKLYKSGINLKYCLMCKNYYMDNHECGNAYRHNISTSCLRINEIEILKRANNCSNFIQLEYFPDEVKIFNKYNCKITVNI